MFETRDEPVSSADIKTYYDGTLALRLRDYVYGNERIEAALALVSDAAGTQTKNVLDVGCGLGIAAAQLATSHPNWIIHGVDISERTIAAARTMFGSDRLIFDCDNLENVPRLAPYDLIALIDVHEHIPRDNWVDFRGVLDRSLSADGVIVITTPSPMYQDHLRRTKPEALQIIDESLLPEDFVDMARAVGGELVEFRYVSIWRQSDYTHAVIRRGISCDRLSKPASLSPVGRVLRRLGVMSMRIRTSRAVQERRQQVRERLGINVDPAR